MIAVERADHSSVVAAISMHADNNIWWRVATEDATVEYGVDDSDIGYNDLSVRGRVRKRLTSPRTKGLFANRSRIHLQ